MKEKFYPKPFGTDLELLYIFENNTKQILCINMESPRKSKNRVIIGRMIRLEREEKGYSQDNMAHELGISQKAYSKIESGETNLSVERIMQITKALDIEITDLLCKGDDITVKKISKSQSVNFEQSDVTNHNNGLEERERTLYEKRITHLEQEVAFLRKLLDK